MRPRLVALGDTAVLVQLGDEIGPALNRRVHALDRQLLASKREGVLDVVPAYASIVVHFDSLVLTHAQAEEWIKEQIPLAEVAAGPKPRRLEVPVRYGGQEGPDLDSVASFHSISGREVAQIHAGRDYTVYMMGFTPGFPYMGILDETIATPRLPTPRTWVPAGSVGIAGTQTGIYPLASPGGWRLIGRTSLRLFSAEAKEPFFFAPGDQVRFVIEAFNA